MAEQNFKVFWDEALKQIKEQYIQQGKEKEFDLWFNMTYVEDSMSDITVSVPSPFMWNQMISLGAVSTIESKIEELCGMRIPLKSVTNKNSVPQIQTISETGTIDSVTFQSQTVPINQQKPNYSINLETSIPKKEAISIFFDDKIGKDTDLNQSLNETEENSKKVPKTHPQLDKDFTFENFINDDESKLTYSMCVAAAKEPGRIYNPILIYGGTGLGKTHLMQSIGNYIYSQPDGETKKICFISSSDFADEFTRYLKNNKQEEFVKVYSKYDLLLLDDIHFFMGKEKLQNELFYIFNALYSKKAQIVFTCDRPISELVDFQERIISRFQQGSILDLQMPAYETRKAILYKKQETMNKKVPSPIIDFIAKEVRTNVREMEGCLKKMIGYFEITGTNYDIEEAKKYLKKNISITRNENITIDRIQKVVANHFNITVADLKSEKRNKNIKNARHIAAYICMKITDFSSTEIGGEFGNRDHSTILHSRDTIEETIKMDSQLNSTIELLIRACQES